MKFLRTLFAAIFVLSFPGAALAHTTITKSNIENGAQVAAAPAAFEFSFGAEVGLAGLELETLDGDPVELDFERPRKMGTDYSVPLPALEVGAYIMKWRAVARDGHVMRGEVDFTITG